MKLLALVVAFCLVYTTVSESCDSTMDCTNKCPDGYHQQCMDNMCKCPTHSCSDTVKCPQGNGTGCPPFCTTTCDNNLCICKWPPQ